MQSSTVIRIPANDKDFEEKCVPLFAGLLNDPNVKTVGASGYRQQGLDLIGRRNRDSNQPVGIQCKLKTKRDRLTPAEVKEEVAKALAVEPLLTEYYIVTTASDETTLDLLAMQLSQEQAKNGRTIDIQVFGWETLQQKIRADTKALDAFDPGHSPAVDALMGISAETLSLVKVQQNQTEIIIQKVDELRLVAPADTARGSALEAHLDKQIDEYRDLMNGGKPRTAADLLTKLEARLSPASSSAIRARVRGNLGSAQIRLGEPEAGGRLLLEAYTLNPTDPKVGGNRVLGLILTGDLDGAFAFAREVLEQDPTNVGAAAFAFQAGALKADLDPETIAPAATLDELIVALHRLNFMQARDRKEEWRRGAKDLFARHPEDDMAVQMAANAGLDEVFDGNAFARSPAMSAAKKTMLAEAIAILEPLWSKTRNYENADEDQYWAIPVNLANAMRAAGRPADAERVIGEALTVAPRNPDALATGVFLAMERDDSNRALELIAVLPEGAMKVVQRLNAEARRGSWQGLLAFAETHPPQPDWSREDRTHFDALVYQAKASLLEGAALRTLTDALVEAWPDSVAILTLTAGRLTEADRERSDAVRARAFSLLNDQTPFGDRLMLAQLATSTNDYDGVIRALDGVVATDYPTRGLLCLAWAFANAAPRPRTRKFFDGLPPTVIDRAEFARLAGAAHSARGDLTAAERHLRKALTAEPSDLRAAMMLYSVLQRHNRSADARSFVLALNETTLKGEPSEFMRLAYTFRREGATDRALALGYKQARSHPRDATVVGAYPGLVLMAKDAPAAVTQLSTGGLHAGFDLEGVGTQDVRGVIEAEAWEGSLALDHPMARALADKGKGDEISLDRPIGGALTYRVRDVRHRYLWLLQDVSARYASQFPDADNFLAMSVVEGDIQPILEVARRAAEPGRALIQAYAESPLPLPAIAAMSGRTVIELAEMVARNGGQVRVCFGALDERVAALRAVKRAKDKGAVVDTLALWTLHRFGLLEATKAYFGRLVVPRSTMDTLIELRESRESHRGQELMTLGFEGEQAIRQVHTPEETEQAYGFIVDTIKAIETHCDIRPSDGAEDLRLDGALDRFAAGEVLDAIHLARAEELLLLSEDVHIRQLAASVGARNGAWLQVVLFILDKAGLIDDDQYCIHIGQLAALRHGHLWLDGASLAGLRRLEDPRKDGLWRAVLPYMFGPGADLISHVDVVADFMVVAMKGGLEPGGSYRAVSQLLLRIVVGQPLWREMLDLLDAELQRRTRRFGPAAVTARTYLAQWMRGHFLLHAASAPNGGSGSSGSRSRQRDTANLGRTNSTRSRRKER